MQKALTVAETTGALSTAARDLIKLSMRANTRRAYTAQLRQWLAWCEGAGVVPLPADPVEVANHLAERGLAGQSVSTLRTVVAAIVFALRRSELVTLDLEKQGMGEGVLRITAKTIEVTFAKSKTSSGKPQSVAVPRAENTEAVKGHRGVDRVKARIAAQHQRLGVSESKAHEDAARYSGHSLRVGFAVTAAEGGADIRSIASVTRHRSLAMPARYAEKADQVRTSPHRLPGVGLNADV